jgi:hypothetical protein
VHFLVHALLLVSSFFLPGGADSLSIFLNTTQ